LGRRSNQVSLRILFLCPFVPSFHFLFRSFSCSKKERHVSVLSFKDELFFGRLARQADTEIGLFQDFSTDEIMKHQMKQEGNHEGMNSVRS